MPSTVIVGAGTFGASLAWWLARAGDEVTLVDQFEPGDPRATSGGESRLIRSGHGPDAGYTASARRARTLWRELEAECGEELLVESGLTWFAHREDGWEAETIATFRAQGIPYERLEPEAGMRQFPSFDPAGLAFLLYEPEAGVLRAQRAVRALARQAQAHGARLVQGRAVPDGAAARLDDGRVLEADVVVWACGGWLGRLFADQLTIRTTRQELFFFDGGPAWRADGVPAYVDFDQAIYGTRDIDGLGVKAAPDFDGPPLDPDAELPEATAASEAIARHFLAERFPGLAGAPLSGSKTCRYELSPDAHFVAAPHPEHPSVWLLGGGSGHGFKHGPAMAERMADALAGIADLPPHFGLHDRGAASSLRTAGATLRAGVGSAPCTTT
jgi:glycine/D-amino acid oxidase-like deaminating enzyme